MSRRVFISYAHADSAWRDRLVTALAPVVRNDELDVWHDGEIAAGADWNATIEAQIARSNVAVLLVSTRFLSSKFIAEVELPRLVDAANAGRLSLVWVPVSASLWERTALAPFQAALDPSKPLDQMPDAHATQALVSVARVVVTGRTFNDVGSGLEIADAVSRELAPNDRPHGVTAEQTATRVEFVERDTGVSIETITAAELERLPEDDHRLVQSLEAGMRQEYERWTALRPRRATLTDSEKQEYRDAGLRMCEELTNLLDFVEVGLHKELRDHYNSIRYSCSKLVALDH